MRLMRLNALLLFCSLVLVGCGSSGGGGGDDETPTGSSNWDEMKWDQGNWS
jgi:hypothetical protein